MVVDALDLGDEYVIPQGDNDEDQAWGEALRGAGVFVAASFFPLYSVVSVSFFLSFTRAFVDQTGGAVPTSISVRRKKKKKSKDE